MATTAEQGLGLGPGLALVPAQLQQEVEQFLYHEAQLLDDRALASWIGLLAHDLRYVMPIRSSPIEKEAHREFAPDDGLAYLDETRASLQYRLSRLDSGFAWSENPPSRTRRLITNVRIRAGETAQEWTVRSAFMLYRNRLERQVDVYVGERQDVLRRVDAPQGFELARRRIVLDQSTMLAPNFSVLI